MPLYIKDNDTVHLVDKLAKLLQLSKQDAVKLAVRAQLDGMMEAIPLRERFAQARSEHPLPSPTGEQADKAFFDDLSGPIV